MLEDHIKDFKCSIHGKVDFIPECAKCLTDKEYFTKAEVIKAIGKTKTDGELFGADAERLRILRILGLEK